ncbi:MAG TPA: hypothetical protein VML55_18180, partial [Planctomycetaceae bacterium]|nr:hypothetical protein [Planctomycetaceae bacterium]
MSRAKQNATGLPLRSQVTCPHCWREFRPYEILWVSAHPELAGDPRLGESAATRFLPTRFTIDGRAVDVKGVPCQQLACPNCHLLVPRALLEMEPLFLSILGAPGSGKSFLLASMTWQSRKTLDKYFRLAFTDADPVTNQMLNGYEEQLFLNADENSPVAILKTEQTGDLYESVTFGERQVFYPKPFVFSIQPHENHPGYLARDRLSRALCLYDNAGEHFLPGGDAGPATQHLALSKVLLFLFDPTQHPKFRKACQGKTSDPQMGAHGWSHRQDQIILEAANRIRTFKGLRQGEKYSEPLVVVTTKFDAWMSLVGGRRLERNWVIRTSGAGVAGLDLPTLQKLSGQTRSLLDQFAPEIVSAAEGFSEDVTYIPSSALGHAPDVIPGGLGIRPRDIRPQWAE